MVARLIMVNGLPGSGKTTLATRLGGALGVPVVSKDALKEALVVAVPAAPWRGLGAIAMEAAWSLVDAMDGTVVLESWWFRPRDLALAEAAWRRCGQPDLVELWCDVPAATARARVAARVRHPLFEDSHHQATDGDDWAARAAPLALGTVMRVDTSTEVPIAALVRELAVG